MSDIIHYEQRRLLNIEAATQLLIEAKTIEEVAEIRNYAEAVRLVARQAKAGLEAQNQAAELKLRAERRGGEMLAVMDKNKGAQGKIQEHTGGKAIIAPDDSPTLNDLGINKDQSSNWQRIAKIPEADFEGHIERTKGRNKELTTAGTVRLAKQVIRDKQRQASADNDAPLQTPSYSLHCTEFQNVFLEQGQLDFVITDPPYHADALHLYRDLGEWSAYHLHEGGSLLVMCGQSYLPEVITHLSAHLTYHWTLAYLTPGGQAVQLWQRNVNTFWKPILWFVKGAYSGQWLGDVAKSATNDNDKNHHDWGQSTSGMLDLMQRFEIRNTTIADPFCGAGTTGIAALKLGCKNFIGVDINEQQIAIAKGRLATCET